VHGPEQGKLREVLLETVKVQSLLSENKHIAISEKGLSVPYHVQPDNPLEKAQANLTARNLIVARSVPNMMFYSLYESLSWVAGKIREQGLVSDDDDPVMDFGIWKATLDAKGVGHYRPRCAVAAVATLFLRIGRLGRQALMPAMPACRCACWRT